MIQIYNPLIEKEEIMTQLAYVREWGGAVYSGCTSPHCWIELNIL